MAYVRESNSSGASACYSRQDSSDDPLLPQKALPLPEDLDDCDMLQNGPADVVAAAASAMAACDSLPDAAAESVIQPLAEAYLLAVRREAQSLPNVVSAVPEGRRKRQCLKTETSAALKGTTVLSTAGPCVGPGSEFTHDLHPSDTSYAESARKTAACECPVSTAAQSLPFFSVAKRFTPAKPAVQSTGSHGFSDMSSDAEEVESISCSVTSPFPTSANGASDSEEELESSGRCEAVSLAQFLNDLRDSNRGTTEGAGAGGGEIAAELFTKERTGCGSTDAVESAQQRNASRSRCKGNEDAKDVAVPACAQGQELLTGAHDSCGQPRFPANATRQHVNEGFPDNVKNSDLEIPPQRRCADARATCDASHVGGTREELSGASADVEGVDRRIAGSCVSRSETYAEQYPKGLRQKNVAAYVDRLVLLDKRREAASASAVAPAAEWRDAALHGFKRLRIYVSSDEFLLAGAQQPEVGTDCLSWSDREWQLYCRCCPPSLRVLASCDTVTVCRLLFLLVEDLKQQQRAVAKAEKRRSSTVHNVRFSSGTSLEGEGKPQTHDGDADADAKDEQTDAVSVTRPQQQRRTGGVKQAGDHDCTFQAYTQQQRREDERGRDQGTKCGYEQDEQENLSAIAQVQRPAEGGHVPSTRSSEEEEGTITADKQTGVVKDVGGSKYGRHNGTGNDADDTEVTIGTSEGACKRCRYRDCYVTLQQACWLFGVFVFLDELQAMDADVASCIQQLRRICEDAREKASCRRSARQLHFPSASRAAEAFTDTAEARKGDAFQVEDKKLIPWMPNDLVAALNLLIVVINDFFNQR